MKQDATPNAKTDMTDQAEMTETPDTDRRNEAISIVAEGLQTMVTGAIEVFGALYDLLELSTKATNITAVTNPAEPKPAPMPAVPEPKEEATPAPTPTPTSDPAPTPSITPDTITKAAVALVRKNRENSKKIKALLQAHGAEQLSALSPNKYEAFLTDLDALNNA